jgi:hemoglobin/transferrin/lactoferrin receptor protein
MRPRLVPLFFLSIFLGLAAFVACPVIAQDAGSRKVDFNIARQPIEQALTALGEQSGLTIIIAFPLGTHGIASGVIGAYTPEEALRLILAPLGLRADYLNARTVAIRRTDADQQVVTPEKVTAPPHAPSP